MRRLTFGRRTTGESATVPGEEGRYVHARNLLLTAEELCALLERSLDSGAWLDGYLSAVGVGQVAEDHLHRDIGFAGAIGDELLSAGGRARGVAGRALAGALAGAVDLRSRSRLAQLEGAWAHDLAGIVDLLAAAVVADFLGNDVESRRLGEQARTARAALPPLPDALRDTVARLPAVFQAFDLDLTDVRRLSAEIVRAHPDRARPILAVGIRTSGSYLAPLVAAFMHADGYRELHTLTVRTQHQLLPAERELVRGIGRRDGLVLVIDDPPGSGRSIARIAAEMERLDLAPGSVVLALPLFGGPDDSPPLLQRFPAVRLASEEWAITDKLRPESVAATLGRLLPDGIEVERVESLPLPSRSWDRSHRRALFAVSVRERGTVRALAVLVEGVGIGYFADHALAVAEALPDYLAAVFGVENGCLYREWLAEEQRACAVGAEPDETLIAAVAGYVAARRRALPAVADRTVDAIGERPVWEVAGLILGRAFGRGERASRLLAVNAFAKHVLRVESPSVVDGATAFSNWFRDERRAGGYVKVDFAQRSFWNLGLTSYDARFDLAGAAVSAPGEEAGERLRLEYERLVGEPIDDERWLLYELAQLWGIERTRPDRKLELRRRAAISLQRYLARLFLDDVAATVDGPLCALDLDGVLESETLGFLGTTGAGALALRALRAHGYRPLIVSGRSSEEVLTRCKTYGLAGGVAEYGSVLCTTGPERVVLLLSAEEQAAVERARELLGAHDGVELDGVYRHVVRAFRRDRKGRRGPLEAGTVAAVLAACGGEGVLRAVVGEGQTDFVAAAVDKGRGVRALVERLGATASEGAKPLALAVGDTGSDLPLLAEAELALAPANADAAVRGAGVEILAAPFQAGVALAVGRLIGHAPGDCPRCAAPVLTPEAEVLIGILSVAEQGRVELARRSVALQRSIRALAR